MKINNIEQEYEKMESTNPRKAAELAYVTAVIAKNKGQIEKAIKYGQKSIDIFDRLNIQSLEESAAIYVTINGVSLPEFIHADVVKDRLLPIDL